MKDSPTVESMDSIAYGLSNLLMGSGCAGSSAVERVGLITYILPTLFGRRMRRLIVWTFITYILPNLIMGGRCAAILVVEVMDVIT